MALYPRILLLIFILQITTVSSDVLLNLNLFSIVSYTPFFDYFNNTCNAIQVSIGISPTVSTDTWIDTIPTNLSNSQYLAKYDSFVSFPNYYSFRIPSPFNSSTTSLNIQMRCSNILISDFVVLNYDSRYNWNYQSIGTWIGSSTHFKLNVTAQYSRSCDNGNGQNNYDCSSSCQPVNDNYYCYSCDVYGQRQCCHSWDIDQVTCQYTNQSYPYTTTYPNNYQPNDCPKNHETLYFWLMIGFAILIIVILVLVVLILICYCFTNQKKSQQVIYAPDPYPYASRPSSRSQSHHRRSERRRRRSNSLPRGWDDSDMRYDESDLQRSYRQDQARRKSRASQNVPKPVIDIPEPDEFIV